jgi:lipopolysaccharide export system protein LptC
MNDRSLPLLPLAILALLGGLTFWLSQYSANQALRNAARDKNVPDVIVERFTAKKLSETGNVQYELTAAKMSHFAEEDSAVLESIVFTSRAPGRADVIARAPTGKSFNGGDRVELEGGVVVESRGGKTAPMTMRTPRVTILPNESIAKSDAGVVVERADGKLTATSFEINSETSIATFARGKLTLATPQR